jgi:hypothetical protein
VGGDTKQSGTKKRLDQDRRASPVCPDPSLVIVLMAMILLLTKTLDQISFMEANKSLGL